MKRYRVCAENDGSTFEVEDPDGRYVLYSDVEGIVAEQKGNKAPVQDSRLSWFTLWKGGPRP